MNRSFGAPLRYGVCLLAGYVLLFLVLHAPFRYSGLGILGQEPVGYLQAAKLLNPIQQFNIHFAGLHSTIARLELPLTFALLFVGYFLALLAARKQDQQQFRLRTVLLGACVFSLPLFVLPYIPSKDIYSYIIYGRMGAIYGANPAVMLPLDFPNDRLYRYMVYWQDIPSIYGPTWMMISHGLTLLVERVGGTLWMYMMAYKLAALAVHLLNATLIWSILGRWKPQQQVWGSMLYAWNPIALVELSGSAHNDAVVACMILSALWLVQRGRWRIAVGALACAALVKWIVIVVLPLFAVMLLRRQLTWANRFSQAAQIGAVAAVVAVLGYGPYWQGGEALKPIITNPTSTQTINSVGALVKTKGPLLLAKLHVWPDYGKPLKYATDTWLDRIDVKRDWVAATPGQHPRTQAILQRVERHEALMAQQDLLLHVYLTFTKAVYALTLLIGLLVLWRTPSFERLVQCSFAMLLVLLLFAPWFWPWYLIWPLALSALLDWRAAGLPMIAFTANASLVYCSIYRIDKLRAPAMFLLVVGLCAWGMYTNWRASGTPGARGKRVHTQSHDHESPLATHGGML